MRKFWELVKELLHSGHTPLLRKGERPHFPNVNKSSPRGSPGFYNPLECKLMAWVFTLLQNVNTQLRRGKPINLSGEFYSKITFQPFFSLYCLYFLL